MHTTTSQQHDTAGVSDTAIAQLRDAGVRVTAARSRVLACLLQTRSALSHNDLQAACADMDRVTLYRALDCLTEAGLAHKITGDDRVFRYSPGPETGGQAHNHTHQHGHFKCTRCTKVFCLDEQHATPLLHKLMPSRSTQHTQQEQLQKALQDMLGEGFESHEMELTIKGWCAQCTDK